MDALLLSSYLKVSLTTCFQHLCMQARGIHTSTGAGDKRRALASCERLALLAGDECPVERRDLGVLYALTGRMAEAAAELQFYADSQHFQDLQSRDRLLVSNLLEAVDQGSSNEKKCERLTIDAVLNDGR